MIFSALLVRLHPTDFLTGSLAGSRFGEVEKPQIFRRSTAINIKG